ncbi:hypothetical protein NC652_013830 [Populus alba x Populus x berolinensis]|nr:hypothetical protein NC652_013830 [Populus alba x Populus x berolinensis]
MLLTMMMMTMRKFLQRHLALVSNVLVQHSNPQNRGTVLGLAIFFQQIRVKLLPQRLPALNIQSQESQMISDLLYRVTALGLVMFFKTRTKNGKHRTWNVDVIDEWVGALIKEQTKRAWT